MNFSYFNKINLLLYYFVFYVHLGTRSNEGFKPKFYRGFFVKMSN